MATDAPSELVATGHATEATDRRFEAARSAAPKVRNPRRPDRRSNFELYAWLFMRLSDSAVQLCQQIVEVAAVVLRKGDASIKECTQWLKLPLDSAAR